jgi:hypothetical protein
MNWDADHPGAVALDYHGTLFRTITAEDQFAVFPPAGSANAFALSDGAGPVWSWITDI